MRDITFAKALAVLIIKKKVQLHFAIVLLVLYVFF